MKIFIQARKYGYSVLYPKPTPTEFYQFAADIQSESADNQSCFYGKSVYSIAFSNDGYIFTKYVIGYDVQRSNLGNIGISVFIPNGKKLLGLDVKTLLDELVKIYCVNYCPDYKISDTREDWLLFTSLANNYDAKLRPDSANNTENLTSGTKEPAFIYYKSEDELQEYFDKPFQEEYCDYRQIFFIDSGLQDNPSNPLNVLRNSGVELKDIDLKNEYYYLNNYSYDKGVTIIANGRNCSDGSYIRAKWQVEIKYSKDERCFFPIEAKGTLYDPDSEIHTYLEIIDNNITIKYEAFIPKPIEKTILFEIKDSYGNSINDAKIQIGNQQWEEVSGCQYNHILKGYDLIQPLIVLAKKESENLFSESITVSPENQIEPIVLQKQKRVKIFACINNNAFPDFKFWINDGKGWRENVTEYVFKGSDIEKTWIIEISKKEGYNIYSEKEEYCPATGNNPLYMQLQKSRQYCIDVGDGSTKKGSPKFSGYTDGRDIKEYIKPPKRHKLIGFEFDENNKGNRDGTITAVYEKEKFSFMGFLKKNKIWFIIISSIAICFIIALLFIYHRYTANEKNTTYGECKDNICTAGNSDSTQMANSINFEQKYTPEESNSEKKNESKKEDENRQPKKQQPSIETAPELTAQPVEQQNLTNKIIDCLKGRELKKATLEDYENKVENGRLKNSIALALKLWDLDGKEGNSYSSYKKELEEDNVLNGSYLKRLVDSMYKKSNPKYVKDLDRNDQIESLSHIKSKLIN